MVAIGVEDFERTVSAKLSALSLAAREALSPRPSRVIEIAPGAEVAWDDCCAGQVWTRLVQIVPSPVGLQTGALGRAMHACQMPFLQATVELGVLRCAATLDDAGRAPSAREISRDGAQGIRDMSALLGVLRCSDDVAQLGAWTPVGPNGGCVGGFWTVQMLLSNCIGCSEEGISE